MKKNIEGVFLLLETQKQEMIFVEENNENNRPWKQKGQYFFPAGTQEKEETIQETINRELEEETGLNGATTIVQETLKKIGEMFLETDEYTLKAHVYTGQIPGDIEIKTTNFNSHEIESIQILHPTEILRKNIEKLRPGLIEALLLKYNIQSETIYIKNGLYTNYQEAEDKIKQIQLLYNK